MNTGHQNAVKSYCKEKWTAGESFVARHPRGVLVTGILLLAGCGVCLLNRSDKGSPSNGLMQEIVARQGGIEKGFAQLSAKLDSLASGMQSTSVDADTKVQEYLTAARAAEDSQIKLLLYRSAMARSVNKAAILQEYIGEVGKMMTSDFASSTPNLTQAETRMGNLVSLCDAVMADCSVEDVKQIPAIRQEVNALNEKLEGMHKAIAMYQESWLDTIRSLVLETPMPESADNPENNDDLNQIKDWCKNAMPQPAVIKELAENSPLDKCDMALQFLQEESFEPTCQDKRDELLVDIQNKRACLTSHDQPLQIPEITENTPWEEWLGHFHERLDTITSEKALQEIEEASAFFQAAKEAGKANQQLAAIDSAAAEHVLKLWEKKVDEYLAKPESTRDAAVASSLLAEGMAFPGKFSTQLKPSLKKLRSAILLSSIRSCEEMVYQVRYGVANMSADTNMQLIASASGQYSQMLLQLVVGGSEQYDDYDKLRSNLVGKINDLNNVVKGIRKIDASDSPDTTRKNQIERYRNYAQSLINDAKYEYKKGEEWRTSSITHFATDPEAAVHYEAAWYTLMGVHPDELQSVDPSLRHTYDTWKQKVENMWKPKEIDYEKTKGKAQHISDM